MYLYLASSSVWLSSGLVKIGCTENPRARLSTYRTGCPPGQTPSAAIVYLAVWETSATTRDELYDAEEEVHERFFRQRLMWEKPGDSEWFRMGADAVDAVSAFVESRAWMRRRVPLEEVSTVVRGALRQAYHANLRYLRDTRQRGYVLTGFQEALIAKMVAFLRGGRGQGDGGAGKRSGQSDARQGIAGIVISPCGTGKTRMGSKSVVQAGVRRCVIGVPSAIIQSQWHATLVAEGIAASDVWFVGGGGSCDLDALFARDTYYVIVLYASSHLLVEHMTERVELLVLDEAHHMAGRVAEESGEGRTRRLMWRACERGVMRLSLTYTPRWIRGDDEKSMSMDDEALFGPVIAELGIRPLIEAGVLPDYRLWMLREGTGSSGGDSRSMGGDGDCATRRAPDPPSSHCLCGDDGGGEGVRGILSSAYE